VKKILKSVKRLTFLPLKKLCSFSGHPSILEVAIENDIPLNHSCGGMGSCTTCRIFVVDGSEKLEARNEIENEHAQMRGFADNERLSCQTSAVEGIVCQIPEDSDDYL
jgi:2Fe-2S ferredoxin